MFNISINVSKDGEERMENEFVETLVGFFHLINIYHRFCQGVYLTSNNILK